MLTNEKSYVNIDPCTTVLSADQQPKEDIMLDQQKITIFYCRLSNEDAQEGFELVKQGLVGCWLVKDLSRFGRDYLTVGQYTDIIFPSYDVRFIAINDGVDSNREDSEGFAAIRNLFNEWYPRDTSKKVRVSLRQRGTSGKHMGKPPYGYCCDPEDKDHWILDEEAAPVVKLIFDLCIDGKGPEQIARILEEKQILTAKALYAKRKKKPMPERPYHWGDQTVVAILEWQEYTGCTCNFKTYSKSYKLKKRIPNEPENMFYLPNTQEAIVSQAQFDRVQELRKNKRRPAKAERQGLFSGLLFCADCGASSTLPQARALRASRIIMYAAITKAIVALVLPTISGRMCFVKSFWNASGRSMSISEVMWTVFRKNGCNAAGLTRSVVSGMTKRKWNRQKNALPIWMSLSPGCMRTMFLEISVRTDTERWLRTMKPSRNG